MSPGIVINLYGENVVFFFIDCYTSPWFSDCFVVVIAAVVLPMVMSAVSEGDLQEGYCVMFYMSVLICSLSFFRSQSST